MYESGVYVLCTFSLLGNQHQMRELIYPTLRPTHDDRHNADDIFQCIIDIGMVSISINLLLKFVSSALQMIRVLYVKFGDFMHNSTR